eukprot:g5710.t1
MDKMEERAKRALLQTLLAQQEDKDSKDFSQSSSETSPAERAQSREESKASDRSNQAPPAAGTKVCEQCQQAPDRLFRCHRCQQSWYCGRDCQRAHWPKHKRNCSPAAPSSQKKAAQPATPHEKNPATATSRPKKTPAQEEKEHRAMVQEAVKGYSPEEIKFAAWLQEHPQVTLTEDSLGEHLAQVEKRDDARRRAMGLPPLRPEKDPVSQLVTGRAAEGRPQVPTAGLHAEPAYGIGRLFPGRYSWTQTVEEAEVRVLLPGAPVVAKQLAVELAPTTLKITSTVTGEVLFHKQLDKKVYVGSASDQAGSFWTLEDKLVLQFHLHKWHSRDKGNIRDASQSWWCRLSTDEEPFADLKWPPSYYYQLKAKPFVQLIRKARSRLMSKVPERSDFSHGIQGERIS